MKLRKCFRVIPAIMMSIALLGLSACQEKSKSEEETAGGEIVELQKIEQQVMDVHDEVMPKMDDLNNTRKKLLVKVQSSDSLPDREQILQTIDKLEEADSLMWDWMHNYSRPDYDSDLDSVRMYLESELKKVNLMKEKFMNSLAAGGTMVEKLKASEE